MRKSWIAAFAGIVSLLVIVGLLRRDNPRTLEQRDESGELSLSSANQKPSASNANSSPLPSLASLSSGVASATFKEWLTSWRSRNTAADLSHGQSLAAERRERMRTLFRENPAQAMAESLSWSEWLSLPPEIKTLVEQPFSAVVDFAVLPNCPPANPSVPKVHPHQILLNGEWHNAYVFGRKTTLTTKEGLPVRGILLDGEVVIGEDAVEQLSREDANAVADLFPAKGVAGLSAISGESISDATTVLIGGTIYQVASKSEAESMSDVIAAAERSFHPKSVAMAMTAATVAGTATTPLNLRAADDEILRATSTWTETPKNTLAVRIAFTDATYSYTLQQMTNLMVNSSNAVKVMSYGKTWLVPRVASVTLQNSRAYYEGAGSGAIVTDTRTALSAIGINRDSYHMVVHAHPGMNVGYAGLGEVGGANNWLNGNVSLEVTVHELGHNYGLLHAHFWAGITGMGNLGREQADGSAIEFEEYGDPFDIMGGSSLPSGQFNARGKAALNWIESKEIINVVTNGIYRVFRYDHKDARTNTGTKLALKIPTPGGEEYWVSHRRLFSTNSSLFRGAHIARSDGGNHQSLVDATPLSQPGRTFDIDRRDPGLAVGKTFFDPLGTMQVTTIASAGVAPLEYIDVQVVFLDEGGCAFYADSNFRTNGLVGSYFNVNLRSRPAPDDWRTASNLTLAGRRIDRTLSFTSDGWGARAPLRLTGGTDANWDTFSVQWDGYIVVQRPVRLATTSDDSSRFWIDLDGNGSFATTGPEFVNNHWGSGQGPTRGDLSPIVYPGTYRIRIQYEEGNGGNYFTIGGAEIPFDVFVDEAGTTPGLTGSYVARSLRTATAQADWRTTQTLAGERIDSYPGFTENSWGSLPDVGLVAGPNGSNVDWDNFSVQWDGYLKVSVPVHMATISDDHSRMWIDVNANGIFDGTSLEYINNSWGGGGQGNTLGRVSTAIQPGMYRFRIQYEEGGGDNRFLLAGVPQIPPDATTLFNNVTFTGVDNRTTPRLIADDFTIQFWLKTTQVAGGEQSWTEGMGLVDASAPSVPSFGITLGNGRVLFGVREADAAPGTTIQSEFVADDRWHHISARREQATGEITLFMDGLEAARGFAATNSLDALSVLTIGSLSSGSQYFIGTIDQVKTWTTARTQEQILADYHQARNTHQFTDDAPQVRIYDRANSVQVHWDPLSSYRILEGASTANGTFTPLGTDQNSTNILMGPNRMRYFRVRR